MFCVRRHTAHDDVTLAHRLSLTSQQKIESADDVEQTIDLGHAEKSPATVTLPAPLDTRKTMLMTTKLPRPCLAVGLPPADFADGAGRSQHNLRPHPSRPPLVIISRAAVSSGHSSDQFVKVHVSLFTQHKK